MFAEFQKLEPNARLLWLGAGELDEPVKELAKELEVEDKCLFMGSVGDVEKWYSAMDILLFPSKMEGLGMVAVEAQTSGLFCIASDQVPEDTKLTENIRYYSLMILLLNGLKRCWMSKQIGKSQGYRIWMK